jgi:apolipoprotein D and lipocalin family protein
MQLIPSKVLNHILFYIILLFFSSSINSLKSQTLETVSEVDLQRYAGKWYEIASFPQRFQKGCHCTTAEYILNEKGFVTVINRCNKDSINGKEISIKGKAFVEEGSNNAKLKVQFFWPFKAKYWIIELADDYSYAVVSHPNRKNLWILSRTAKMDDKLYHDILVSLNNNGLNTKNLNRTIHR